MKNGDIGRSLRGSLATKIGVCGRSCQYSSYFISMPNTTHNSRTPSSIRAREQALSERVNTNISIGKLRTDSSPLSVRDVSMGGLP